MSDDLCPGGMHPRDGQVCCDACWARAPRTLNGKPWRGRRRALVKRAYRSASAWREAEDIDAALVAWLQAHPSG